MRYADLAVSVAALHAGLPYTAAFNIPAAVPRHADLTAYLEACGEGG